MIRLGIIFTYNFVFMFNTLQVIFIILTSSLTECYCTLFSKNALIKKPILYKNNVIAYGAKCEYIDFKNQLSQEIYEMFIIGRSQ